MFFTLVTTLLALFLLMLGWYVAKPSRHYKVQATQAYALFQDGEMHIHLPHGKKNVVYTMEVSISGTDAERGDPVISPPDIMAIENVQIREAFTHDITWDPHLLPRERTFSSRDATYTLTELEGRQLRLRFQLGERAYLAGFVEVRVVAIFPRPQPLGHLRIDPVQVL